MFIESVVSLYGGINGSSTAFFREMSRTPSKRKRALIDFMGEKMQNSHVLVFEDF